MAEMSFGKDMTKKKWENQDLYPNRNSDPDKEEDNGEDDEEGAK